VPSTAATDGDKPGWTPSIVKPVAPVGDASSTRRPLPSKSLIAVIAIVVGLAAIIWALLS
jgi:hypothetical protein